MLTGPEAGLFEKRLYKVKEIVGVVFRDPVDLLQINFRVFMHLVRFAQEDVLVDQWSPSITLRMNPFSMRSLK